ncbi:hypothetical protein EV360DRAFT_74381 [Lentinula raphanica]|nr:hypothetical protein EV360DRAFT_74381 [Lentinula raphanica]
MSGDVALRGAERLSLSPPAAVYFTILIFSVPTISSATLYITSSSTPCGMVLLQKGLMDHASDSGCSLIHPRLIKPKFWFTSLSSLLPYSKGNLIVRMEHPYEREASEHRKGRVPKLRRVSYDETSSDTVAASAAASSDVEGVTEKLKKTFAIIYKKHGSFKERRDLNVKYRHVGCEQCETRKKPCEVRATALQCKNCPPYIKCTRVAVVKKLRVLDLMDITEHQYDVLLAWYKQSLEDELLKPLREALQMDQTVMSKVEPPSDSPSSSSSDELGSPEASSPQVVPVSSSGKNRSQAYRKECPSHVIDVPPVPPDNRNASQAKTESPLPPKHASNPYPTAPVSPSYYRGTEGNFCTAACDVPGAQPYGDPGQLTSVVTWNRMHYPMPYEPSSAHSSSQSLESYYSGGIPRSNTLEGQANYDYHSQSGSPIVESNLSRAVQRSSSYPGLPEVTKPLLTRSWSAGAVDYAVQGAEDRSTPDSYSQFEDVKASPPSQTWESPQTENGPYTYPGQYGIEHLYQANSGTP